MMASPRLFPVLLTKHVASYIATAAEIVTDRGECRFFVAGPRQLADPDWVGIGPSPVSLASFRPLRGGCLSYPGIG